MNTVSPTEKLAALEALKEGVDAAIEQAKDEVRTYRDQTGSTGFATDWGKIVFARNGGKVKVLRGEALIAYAREHYPHEVVEAKTRTVTVDAYVHESLINTLEARYQVTDGKLEDTDTGELMDDPPPELRFLVVEPAKADTVRFTMPKAKKLEAAQLISERVEQITAAIRPAIEVS